MLPPVDRTGVSVPSSPQHPCLTSTEPLSVTSVRTPASFLPLRAGTHRTPSPHGAGVCRHTPWAALSTALAMFAAPPSLQAGLWLSVRLPLPERVVGCQLMPIFGHSAHFPCA